MSFEEQERVMFDLLFDSDLRDNFCDDAMNALADYELDEAEHRDFAEIRPDALQLDAKMRRDILLSHICRAFPISFAILSSLANGKSLLKKLVDTQTMRSPSLERQTVFGSRLRDELTAYSFDTSTEQPLIIAILEAELAMAWTAATLKREVLESGQVPAEPLPVTLDWSSRPVKLAAYVGAAIIPRSYTELKRAFCGVADTELWSHLRHSPVSKSLRNKTLAKEDPRLLVMRARICHMSYCEPTVDHQTAELSEGFAPLFQHVNGTASVEQILAQLKQAGAPDQILQGVQSGFRQLLENGMLEVA
jgi:hypothetical protein